jgi:hypothetical protein
LHSTDLSTRFRSIAGGDPAKASIKVKVLFAM